MKIDKILSFFLFLPYRCVAITNTYHDRQTGYNNQIRTM